MLLRDRDDVALGAAPGTVLRLVLGQAATLIMVAVVVGGAGALAAGKWLSFQLYDVSPRDPLVFGSVACLLVMVALAAAFIPARRAAGVDPLTALRSD